MVTVNTHKNNTWYGYEVYFKSTDEKPTENIPNGSPGIEIDTGKGYLFDSEAGEWCELPAGGSVVINPARGVEF